MKDWQNFLDKIRIEFRDNKPTFLKQKTIAATTHPRHGGMNLYVSLSGYDKLDKVKDPQVGSPDIQFGGSHSLTAVQSAHYIKKMEEHMNIRLEDLKEVFDIGAGYGHLCYSFYQCGFDGKYNLIDFPIMNEIQEYFLKLSIGNKNYWPEPLQAKYLDPETEDSLLIGTFSINEMPLKDRVIIEPFYKKYKYIMIVHKNNSDFGVDNKKYFKELSDSLSTTHEMKFHKCPLRKNDYYLFGVRK